MSKHDGRPAVPVKGRKKPLASHNRGKDYFCTVISEDVVIALRNKPSFGIKPNTELFVKCNQSECQYVDLNQSPCPLRLDLFAEEIEKREEKRRDKRMGF
jgi:hypothetical protein